MIINNDILVHYLTPVIPIQNLLKSVNPKEQLMKHLQQ